MGSRCAKSEDSPSITEVPLNFDSMKELVTTTKKRDEVITIQEPHKIVRKGGHI